MGSAAAGRVDSLGATSGRLRLADVVGQPDLLDDADGAQIAALLVEVSALEARFAGRLAHIALEARDVNEERLLTIDEAAKFLRLESAWVRRRTNELPFIVRISGGAVRVSRRRLEAWVARRTGGGR